MNNIKKFEINKNILKDFDKLMTMQLNEVVELKVTEINNNSKLLNIISLCTNIKTLIIEGDQRINTNSIIINLCKPELLDNLVLKGVKLPSGHALKKMTKLKKIILKDIRFTNIGLFFTNISNPELVEDLNLINVDFEKNNINILEKYLNLKHLRLDNVTNCYFDNLENLIQNDKLEELEMYNIKISVTKINCLFKGKSKKDIRIEMLSEENFIISNTIIINQSNQISLTLNISDLNDSIELYKVDNLTLILDSKTDINLYTKKLKEVKKNIIIAMQDTSFLALKDAKKIKDKLKVDYVIITNTDNFINYNNVYSIDYFIKIKQETEKYLNLILDKKSDVVNFLQIYKVIGENLYFNEELCNQFFSYKLDDNFIKKKNNNIEKKDFYANILQDCLKSLNIESVLIKGNLSETRKNHIWNQVKLENKWYNVDLALDSKYISSKKNIKKKVRYCLLNDSEFSKTHIPKNNIKNKATENFDIRILSIFFKTGIYSKNFINSYFQGIIKKIKFITVFNRQKLLPVGKNLNKKE